MPLEGVAFVRPVAIIPWLKGRATLSRGSNLRTQSPRVLSSIRGYWTLATKTFELLFLQYRTHEEYGIQALEGMSFLMKLSAEEPIEECL